MTREEKKKVAALERDIKKMQRENKKIFAEFNKKKSPAEKISAGLKKLFGK